MGRARNLRPSMNTRNITSAPLRHLCLGVLLAGFLAPAASSAATIEPTTWYSAGTAGTPVVGDGLQFVTNGDTTSTVGAGGIQHILTYFSPASIANVGDSIGISLTFRATGVSTTTSLGVGFAFYDSGGNQISANGLGQNNAAFSAYRGYRVAARPQTNAGGTPLELRGRTVNNTALANTTSHAYVIGSGGETSVSQRNIASNTLYDVSYVLTRTAEDTIGVAFSLVGGSLAGYNGSWSIASTVENPLFTTFDTFAISLNSASVFSTITLYDVSIAAIPEPSTAAALVGLGALGLASLRRRRR